MERRNFIKAAGAGAMALGLPGEFWAALSGLSGDQIEQRIKEILPQLSLEQKVELMAGHIGNMIAGLGGKEGHGYTGYTIGNEKLGIPRVQCLDGPRGVGFYYKTTCFPVAINRAATWDVALEKRVGDAMGYECRALGGNMLLAPTINLLWHPRWGRAQESFGEDPHILGTMGAAFITGLQQHVMCSVKHYAVNNTEDTRMNVNAVVDERTLREVFIPHFKKCIDVGAACVMSSYNHLNGPKAGQNKHLIHDILKTEWKWDGFVVSDWVTAMDNTIEAGNAGLDLEMPQAHYYGKNLVKAVKDGKVPEANIDDSVSRMIRQLLRFVGPDFTSGYDQAKIAGADHAAVAREAAEKGCVLLKNEKQALPLDKNAVKTLALVGEFVSEANIGDHGSSRITPPYTVSLLDGIKAKAPGIKLVVEKALTAAAVKKAAAGADAVIVCTGLNFKDEGEGHDRAGLGLSSAQEAMIKAAAEANPRTIVVLHGGSSITMPWKDQPAAILMAWYPGLEGGNALANVLFGDVNPSGKLPVVFPQSEDQLFPFAGKDLTVEYKGQWGYRWLDAKKLEPLFPFGFGLSYTEYKHANLRLDKKTTGKSGKIIATVDVTNTGKRAGEEVVQLYVGYQGSKVERAPKDLKAFARVSLAPGETKPVTLELSVPDLAYYDVGAKAWVVEEIEYSVLAGPSSRNADLLKDSFKVSGT
jgi:beta-glucosidase